MRAVIRWMMRADVLLNDYAVRPVYRVLYRCPMPIALWAAESSIRGAARRMEALKYCMRRGWVQ